MNEPNPTQASAPTSDPPPGEGASTTVPKAEAVSDATGDRRRGLKLVVTLEPTGDAGYRAVLALGADGCDPSFRTAAVDGLPAALDEVPALLADAEARWQEQPRYPTLPASSRSSRSAAAADRAATAAAPAPAPPPEPPTERPMEAAKAPKPAPKGQLDLFA